MHNLLSLLLVNIDSWFFTAPEPAPCLVCFDELVLFGSDADKRSPPIVLETAHFFRTANIPVHPPRHENAFPSHLRVNMDETPAAYQSGSNKVIGQIGQPVNVAEAKGVNDKRMATLMVAAAPPNRLQVMIIFRGSKFVVMDA